MNWKKFLLILAVAGAFTFASATKSDAHVSIGIGIGIPIGYPAYAYPAFYGYYGPVFRGVVVRRPAFAVRHHPHRIIHR